jgi:hypothetical protein
MVWIGILGTRPRPIGAATASESLPAWPYGTSQPRSNSAMIVACTAARHLRSRSFRYRCRARQINGNVVVATAGLVVLVVLRVVASIVAVFGITAVIIELPIVEFTDVVPGVRPFFSP